MRDTIVRPEQTADAAGVRAIHEAAFDTRAEADLVDALRARAAPLVSLVAERQGAVVGHILFSPVTLADSPRVRLMGLAPLAVLPTLQRQGIGSSLVEAGIRQCTNDDFEAIVVLGHPHYYPRFGFSPASRFGIRCEYDAPNDAFMLLELKAGVLRGLSGTVRYHATFGEV